VKGLGERGRVGNIGDEYFSAFGRETLQVGCVSAGRRELAGRG